MPNCDSREAVFSENGVFLCTLTLYHISVRRIAERMTSDSDVSKYRNEYYSLLGKQVAEALTARNFEVYLSNDSAGALDLALRLMPEGSSVAWGGSATIDQIGLTEAVKNGNYTVYDRSAAKSPEEKNEIIRKAFSADFYLTSFNAVSLSGKVFNVDGTGNRVAAITYGPKNVIAVVGVNKVCHSEESARERALGIAAEINAVRFGKGERLFTDDDLTDDVPVDDRICNFIEEIAWCNPQDRIKIILVAEELGF